MGLRLARRANNSASANAPTAPMTQPSTVRLPTVASVAGRRNTPDPIMLPATTIVARTGPSLRWPATNYLTLRRAARPARGRGRGIRALRNEAAHALAEAAQRHFTGGHRAHAVAARCHAVLNA